MINILNEAHAPNKVRLPRQRLTENDYIPGYMKQTTESCSSGGGSKSDRDRRVTSETVSGSASCGQKKKIIFIPNFEKIDLPKSENPWVRPAERLKTLPEEEKEIYEFTRSVRRILNKLTVKNFIRLLKKMKKLKMDTKEKLEIAVGLIFEEAVREPLYTEAYANLCHRLTDKLEPPDINGTAAFKRILINLCQDEFEKNISEEDKSKTFDTETESKMPKDELDHQEPINRKRRLGCILFIAELFKLKMISETVIHSCISRLLECEKLVSAENQLECLCKLLATVGKDLDHPKSKVDQYFTEMSQIISRKKISARTKLAINDVFDLRSCNWIPNRNGKDLKTIDQIHRKRNDNEMMRRYEEKEMEKIRQQVEKNEAHREKNESFKNTSLGSVGFKNSWSIGTCGGNSRSSSGAFTSVIPDQQNRTRQTRIDSKLESRKSNTSRNSSAKHVCDNRNVIICAAQDLTTKYSQSPNLHDESWRSGFHVPNKYVDIPIDQCSSVTEEEMRKKTKSIDQCSSVTEEEMRKKTKSIDQSSSVTEEEMRKKTKSIINQYLSINDKTEAIACLKELKCPYLHCIFVEEAIAIVLKKKSEERKSVGGLLHDMIGESVITVDQLCHGLAAIVKNAPYWIVDAPHFCKHIGETIGPMVYDGVLPLNRVKDTLEPLVKPNKSGEVIAEALLAATKTVLDI